MIVNYGRFGVLPSLEARLAIMQGSPAVYRAPAVVTPADPLARKFDPVPTPPPEILASPFPIGLVIAGVGVAGLGLFFFLRSRKKGAAAP